MTNNLRTIVIAETPCVIPNNGYILVVNANPLTGVPAVLGQLSQKLDDLVTFGVPWRQLKTVPIHKLNHQQPKLYQQIVDLAQERKQPTQFLFQFCTQTLELQKEEPLVLSAACILRYFYSLLEKGKIGTEEFLHAIPLETITQGHAYLNPQHNSHLIPVTQGTAISGSPTKGVLVTDQSKLRVSAANSSGYIVLVDRVEAHHTALLNDSGCSGVMALRGSPADHFALLAREKNFPYMVLEMHSMSHEGLHCPDRMLPFSTFLTVDFSTGKVYLGDGVIDWKLENPAIITVQQLLSTQDSSIPLRLNLDTADDIVDGLPVEAAGVGLLRTEHLLRRSNMQEILRQFLESDNVQTRKKALVGLSSFFHREFTRCFTLAKGLPVTIRLLDYPLHELGGSLSTEVNPMLGLRGVRQGIQWPDLYIAQIEAILHAATSVRHQRLPLHDVEVMVPLVNFVEEVCTVRKWIKECQKSLSAASDVVVKVGAMVETPAAALSAATLAKECDFLSFGTNDLTQFFLGLSREDYPEVFRAYQQRNLLHKDPFQNLDPTLLQLIRDAATKAKEVCPSIVIGLCGVHAAQPEVLELCRMGLLDYLSIPQHQLLQVKLQAIQSLGSNREGGKYIC